MDKRKNDTPPLTVALLGVNDECQAWLDWIWSDKCAQIVAVGDLDPLRAETVARRYDAEPFSDYRRMIIQRQPNILLIGAPAHQAFEHIRLAIQKKCHVLTVCPPAVNFEQGAELIMAAAKEKVLFVAAQTSRFAPSFYAIKTFLRDSVQQDNTLHLISAVCHIPIGPLEPAMRWLYDPQLAGGGVLMQNTYRLIDELTLCFGLPERVYALTQSQAPDRQQRIRFTEDNALVIMQYSDTLMAQVCASRTLGPARQHLRIHGKKSHLTATPEQVIICDNSGVELENKLFPKDAANYCVQKMLENFFQLLADPSHSPSYLNSTADLNTLAVIEAAYLSSRTGMPEEPARILNLAKTQTSPLF